MPAAKTITTLTLAGALLLSACSATTTTTPTTATTGQHTSMAPTPRPTPSPTQEEISIQEVKDAFTAYTEAYDEASAAGYTPETIASVLDYLTADGSARLEIVSGFNSMAAQGISMTGNTVIGSVTATSYTPGTQTTEHDDFSAEVVITACTDLTGKTVYHDGEEVEATGLVASCSSVTWINQGTWLMDSSEVTAEEYH